jgi:hypothetical protein
MAAILSALSRIPISWDMVANTAAGTLVTSTVAGGVALVASGVNNLFKEPEVFDGETDSFHGTQDVYWQGNIPRPGETFQVVRPFFFTKSAKEAAYYALNTDIASGKPVFMQVRPVKEQELCVKTNLFGKNFFSEKTSVKVERVITGKEAIEQFLKTDLLRN